MIVTDAVVPLALVTTMLHDKGRETQQHQCPRCLLSFPRYIGRSVKAQITAHCHAGLLIEELSGQQK